MESACLYLFITLFLCSYISSELDSFISWVNVFVTLLVLATGKAQIDVWVNR